MGLAEAAQIVTGRKDDASTSSAPPDKDTQTKTKKGLFGLGKKDAKDAKDTKATMDTEPRVLPTETSHLSTATRSTARSAASPSRSDYRAALASSPSRGMSSSPRMSSPARSQIFERDVQDEMKASSPAIPAHIATEDHIPPVLNDASDAIANASLDPDTVEIVTHTSHQPAAVTVTGAQPSSPYDTPSEWTDLAHLDESQATTWPDTASNYGSLDSADVKRLSFISFADVVQSEHPTGGALGVSSRESIHMAGLTSLHSARSPSPIRSPVSSQPSPPTSNPGSVTGVEMSPGRKPIGSPGSATLSVGGGDLNIETMRQALRRTGSREFNAGSVRSLPQSPVEAQGPLGLK